MTETIRLLSYHYGAGFSRVLLNFTFSKYNLDGELTKMFCYSVCMTIICTEICCSTPIFPAYPSENNIVTSKKV